MSRAEIGLAVSVFLACTVEAVEALTIVLAVGTTRGWPSGEAALLVIVSGLLLVAVVTSRRVVVQGPLAEQGRTTHPSTSGPRIRATWAGQRLLGAWGVRRR
jgi:uncharacterized integral membrane protein